MCCWTRVHQHIASTWRLLKAPGTAIVNRLRSFRRTGSLLVLLTQVVSAAPIWSQPADAIVVRPATPTNVQERYRLGPGDLLELVILDPAAKELGGQVEVLNDGTVSLPLLGSVVIEGLTSNQASRWLAQLYRRHLLRPELTVRVIRPRPIQVSVVGEVENPGLYSLTSTEVSALSGAAPSSINGLPTVVTALQKAGGVTLNADLSRIVLQRGRYRTLAGSDEEQQLNLMALLKQGDQSQNPFLFDGDSVIVSRTATPDAEAAELAAANLSPKQINVTVVGEVVTPGRLQLKANTPVMEAVLAAGGPKTWRARTNNIELVRLNRNNTVTHQLFRLDYSQPISSLNNPALKDGDTVIVNRSLYAKTSDAIGAISDPLAGLVNIWALVNLINNPAR